MGNVLTLLVIAVRSGLGLALAMVFSIIGLGLAWGLYWFSSVDSLTALLYLFLSTIGIGAGVGGFLAWLRIDRNPPSVMVTTLMVAILAGFGGAWGGYEYGQNVEAACCVEPEIEPMMYAALGATVVANAAVVLLSFTRNIITKKTPLPARWIWNPPGSPQQEAGDPAGPVS
jgi:hypothetical protein